VGATPDDCIKAVATGVPVHTSVGEVSTQLTRCSGDVCPLPRATTVTALCQSLPPVYRGVQTPVQHSRRHCLALSAPCVWCQSSALVASDDITILSWTLSRYRDPQKVHDPCPSVNLFVLHEGKQSRSLFYQTNL